MAGYSCVQKSRRHSAGGSARILQHTSVSAMCPPGARKRYQSRSPVSNLKTQTAPLNSD